MIADHGGTDPHCTIEGTNLFAPENGQPPWLDRRCNWNWKDSDAANARRKFQCARHSGFHGGRERRSRGDWASRGGNNPKVVERAKELKIDGFKGEACPVVFWDVFGEQGHPVRATVSELGPLLLGRLLELNDTQEGVLNMVVKIADENGLLLLVLKDMRSMMQFVADNADQFKTQYGNVSAASAGAIQRSLLALE